MRFTTTSIILPALLAATMLAGCKESPDSSKKFNGEMVLAISWQPAFCETRPRVRECRSQKAGRFDITHFSLHGLWPQPRSKSYCGVDEPTRKADKAHRWQKLRGLGLSTELQTKLRQVMPGSQSFLHRHEWIKHGTCYSMSPEVYFADSVALMEQINASSVRQLFEDSIGKPVSGSAIRRAFDEAFGPGVGARVRVACKRDGKRTIITELTLGLAGEITPDATIQRLALASPRTKPGCPKGIVDPVGFQ